VISPRRRKRRRRKIYRKIKCRMRKWNSEMKKEEVRQKENNFLYTRRAEL